MIYILHLEDDPKDAELVQATLVATDMTCQITRVQTRDEFSIALQNREYDVILADFRLPAYDGMSALQLVQELRPDIPFIFVSGTMGEDAAIEGLTQGATDYVLKQKLSRLVPAIKRALSEAENQRERKLAEEQIRKALAEKETLLRELYHRTRNNMSVIISMLRLQANCFEDERLKEAFVHAQNRIHAMALVHQKLYEAHDLSRVNLKEYITDLARLLMSSYKVSYSQVSLITEMEDVFVLIDTAIPCGLILNELISNALKHAFPAEREGKLTIQLHRQENGEILLRVADNGVGMPEGFDLRQNTRLGLCTVFSLGEDQLGGKLTVDTCAGFACQLQFRDNLYTPRV